MNVLNAEKLDLHADIVGFRFVALSRGTIGHGIDLQQTYIYSQSRNGKVTTYSGSRVDDVDALGARGGT